MPLPTFCMESLASGTEPHHVVSCSRLNHCVRRYFRLITKIKWVFLVLWLVLAPSLAGGNLFETHPIFRNETLTNTCQLILFLLAVKNSNNDNSNNVIDGASWKDRKRGREDEENITWISSAMTPVWASCKKHSCIYKINRWWLLLYMITIAVVESLFLLGTRRFLCCYP